MCREHSNIFEAILRIGNCEYYIKVEERYFGKCSVIEIRGLHSHDSEELSFAMCMLYSIASSTSLEVVGSRFFLHHFLCFLQSYKVRKINP